MPSPFPGVDPYLETSGGWLGFHQRFITYASDFLNERLPDSYAAMIEERVQMVLAHTGTGPDAVPDISVARDPVRKPPGAARSAGSGSAVLEPHVLTLPDYVEVMEGYIEIRRFPETEVVTCIELLSPSNKIDPGREQYLAKRGAIFHRGVHLVEIDLLASGHRLETVEPLPAGNYYAFVSRADHRPKSHVYAWDLRHPLPEIPIPLKSPDADVFLDMAQIFTQTYDRGLYARSLRYNMPLSLPLPPDDLAWARERGKTEKS